MQAERNFLLEQFREFYATCLRLKQEIEEKAARAAAQEEDDDPQVVSEEDIDVPLALSDEGEGAAAAVQAQTPEAEARRIQDELLALVQGQAQAVMRRGDEREARRYREVQYVMAALADEVFLNVNWEGREYWAANLLEQSLFHTHDAGTRFFTNLEELLKGRDPTRAEVAAAYLLALSLGFRGRYQDIESQPRLENFRHQLFALLFQRNAGLAEDAQLYPQTYAHTLAGKQVQWLPVLRPWLLAMGGVVLGYLVLSHAIWAHEIDDVSDIAQRVGAQLHGAGAGKTEPPRPAARPAAAPAPATVPGQGQGPGQRQGQGQGQGPGSAAPLASPAPAVPPATAAATAIKPAPVEPEPPVRPERVRHRSKKSKSRRH